MPHHEKEDDDDDDVDSNRCRIPPGDTCSEEYLEGFKVVKDQDDAFGCDDTSRSMGRVSIATKDFKVDEIVLKESPILIVDPNHPKRYQGVIESYYKGIVCAAKDNKRSDIMDMHCPSDDDDDDDHDDDNNQQQQQKEILRQRMEMLTEDWEQWLASQQQQEGGGGGDPSNNKNHTGLVTLEDCKRLVRIIDANAHCYDPTTTVESPTTTRTDDDNYDKDNVLLALFVRGSKVEHSCSPNLSHSIRDGKLQYKAIRPIHKGERVSISYGKINKLLLPDTYDCYSRKKRQEFLLENKFFHCRCNRCLGPDECNPYYVSCDQCNNQQRNEQGLSLACSYCVAESGADDDNQRRLIWRCVSCQSEIVDLQKIQQQQHQEALYDEKMSALLHDWQQQQQQQQQEPQKQQQDEADAIAKKYAVIAALIGTLNDISSILPAFHWIRIKGYRLLTLMTTVTTEAAVVRKTKEGNHQNSVEQVTTNNNNTIPAVQQYLLYLNTLALLLQARWVLRMGRIIYGDMPLQQLQQKHGDDKKYQIPHYPQQELQQQQKQQHLSFDSSMIDIIENLSKELSEEFASVLVHEEGTTTAGAKMGVVDEMVDPIFRAGQNWMMLLLLLEQQEEEGGDTGCCGGSADAGSSSSSRTQQQQQVAKLYDTFLPLFRRRRRWDQLGNENYQKIVVLIQQH